MKTKKILKVNVWNKYWQIMWNFKKEITYDHLSTKDTDIRDIPPLPKVLCFERALERHNDHKKKGVREK